MRGFRTVIPEIFHTKLLNYLLVHETHSGLVRMKSLARQYFWWSNLDMDIEKLVRNCENCSLIKAIILRKVLPFLGPCVRDHGKEFISI